MESIPKSLKITLIVLITILAIAQLIGMRGLGSIHTLDLFRVQCAALLIGAGVLVTQFLLYKQKKDTYFSSPMLSFLFIMTYLLIAGWLMVLRVSETDTDLMMPDLLKINATLSVILIAVLIGYHISKTEKIVDKY